MIAERDVVFAEREVVVAVVEGEAVFEGRRVVDGSSAVAPVKLCAQKLENPAHDSAKHQERDEEDVRAT